MSIKGSFSLQRGAQRSGIAQRSRIRCSRTQCSRIATAIAAVLLVSGTSYGQYQTPKTQPDQAPVEPALSVEGDDAGDTNPETLAEARNRFGRGLQLYEDGDFALALIEFQRAHELVSNYRVLYNIGQVSVQLRQYARARTALESYLAQGGSEIEPQRAAEVGADIEMLKSRTAFILVESKQAGAQILIDEVPAGITPIAAPLLVDAGVHRVEARKVGHKSVERFVTLAGGDDQKIAIELTELVEPTRTVEKQTIVVHKPDTATDATWTWVGLGSTALLGVGAVATGILGLTATSDLESLRNTPDVSREELDGASSRAKRMFLATDILGGAAILLGGTTLFFALTRDDAPADAPKVKVGVSLDRVTLTGAF